MGRAVLRAGFCAALLALQSAAAFCADERIATIRSRGTLQCGTSEGTAGITMPDNAGAWTGIYADLCRALAAAILGRADKVSFIPTTTATRFTALQSGDIDVLSRTATATLTREAVLGLRFAPVWFYDGQAIIVRRSLGVTSARQLNGATICLQQGSTSELNIAEWSQANNVSYSPVSTATLDGVEQAFLSGRCDAYTNDSTPLIGLRLKASAPDDYVILPERISKEPTSIAVRRGDDQFYDVVRWAVFALIEAEELGITAANVDDLTRSGPPAIKRLLSMDPGLAKALNIDERWIASMVKAVGNYGEIFERNLGQRSPIRLERGLNDLWSRGGLMYAWPVR